MSFLDSVLSSIETGKPSPIPPPKPAPSRSPAPAVSTIAEKSGSLKSTSVSQDVHSNGGQATTTTGTKRKAEEQLRRPPKLDTQVSSKPTISKSTPLSAVSKPRPPSTSTNLKSAKPPNTVSSGPSAPSKIISSTASSKAPPKGSYADLMAKAKALQEKAPAQVGMFRHQSAPKERVSKVERKRRVAEAQVKEKDVKIGKKPSPVSGAAAAKDKARDGSISRKPEEPSYKGTARPSQTPAYRGTSGLPAKRDPNDRYRQGQSSYGRRSRGNEYLGTDEEDEGDVYDDHDDYYSDASSDMEAGLDDMESEEAAALAAAKREDEEEWRAELAAKKDKLERRQKLTILASKQRR
ncbi:hypothetical protein ASPZODRAFT_117274 [Penicilliopsis zonata CBS 506.65]|uniref:SPT2 chromatin protein n=1 Tax=Penicilliopsis zonata CBS 506.65 TaxID=1073090 RepID=A0A1L9SHM8_9EURO|nr:hypothetical protein ASPZODRAFT_117274 [Penicilliopsis zonata CBS 506.65]OJJ46637.1 hypothetical protein ASPZODRAFT_117274 [Penicilliopsis zonata CBS 506.65]